MKNQTCNTWKFLQPSLQLCIGDCVPYFKIKYLIFCCFHLFSFSSQDQQNGQQTYSQKVSNLCYDYWKIHLWVKNLNLIIFTHVPKQTSKERALKVYFFPAERGEDYGDEKMIKIKLARAFVSSFDKFCHLCNLEIFGFFLLCHNLNSSLLNSNIASVFFKFIQHGYETFRNVN